MTFAMRRPCSCVVVVVAGAGRRPTCAAAAAAAVDALAASGLRHGRARRLGLRRHLPSLCSWPRCAVLIFALSRPQATLASSRVERHGDARLRRVQQHGRRRRRARPGSAAAQDGPRGFVEAQPATVDIGVVAFGQGALTTQQPTERPRRGRRRDQAAEAAAGGTSLGQAILAALSTIAGTPVALPDPEQPRRRRTRVLGVGDDRAALRRRGHRRPRPRGRGRAGRRRRRAHRDHRRRHRRRRR